MKYELRTLNEYSDVALLSELRRVAVLFNGTRLTVALFGSRSRVHSSTLRRRFGSWSEALDKAGIEEGIAPRNRRRSRKDIIQAIQQFAIENPGQPATVNAIAKRLSMYRATISKKFGK